MKSGKPQLVVLLLNALAFGFFGAKWLLTPLTMSAPLGITLSNADAITDAQAVYGGLELGVAAFLVVCALRKEWRQVGMLAATLTLAGLGLSRLTGILMATGHVTSATTQLLMTDLVGTTLNLVVFLLGARAARTANAR